MSVKNKGTKKDVLLSLMIKKEGRDTTYMKVFREEGNIYYIPMAYAVERGLKPCAPSSRSLWNFCGNFISEEQKIVFDETLENLARARTCILSVHVGFGKTFIALKLAAFIGIKTLIVIPTSKKVLQAQWASEIQKFIPNIKVQLLDARSKLEPETSIYIIGSHTIPKIEQQLARAGIGLAIVDEMHLVLSPKGFESLLCITPSYMLGLSATPYRLDGSNALVELFFGKAQVFRKLNRKYIVNIVQTSFKFVMEKNSNGELNWVAVLKQQASLEERNDLIAKIILGNKNKKFLVLCKMVNQIKEVAQKCRAGGLPIQAVYDNIQPIKDSRSLIGSTKKLGVGFSDESFNALIIAADVQDYFIQYFGRVLRRPDACPLIYDIVDNCYIMQEHYRERKIIYETSGGIIRTLSQKDFD